MTQEKPITIFLLGGTSHIAKGLVSRFLACNHVKIDWFGRSRERMEAFLRDEKLSGNISLHDDYGALSEISGDVLINCVGAGSPLQLKEDYTLWFSVLETYDNICLEYLQKSNPHALYIHFSSGAVYGRNLEDSSYKINPNNLSSADFYALAKLYAEAKHRAYAAYNIVDIRVFSYFSRYADSSAGYLMTDILKALLTKTALKTIPQDMIRDFISPDDLFTLVQCCIAQDKINTALDAFSKKPVSKQEMIAAFKERFGLNVEMDTEISQSPNQTSSIYVPKEKKAMDFGFSPIHSSLEGLLLETKARLEAEL